MGRKYLIFILLLFLGLNVNNQAYSDSPSISSNTISAYVNYNNCIKNYKIDEESLYYLTLSAISNAKYKILEIQTRSGYILFSAYGREFLAQVVKVTTNLSELKITPQNNSYLFDYNLIYRIFNDINLNLSP